MIWSDYSLSHTITDSFNFDSHLIPTWSSQTILTLPWIVPPHHILNHHHHCFTPPPPLITLNHSPTLLILILCMNALKYIIFIIWMKFHLKGLILHHTPPMIILASHLNIVRPYYLICWSFVIFINFSLKLILDRKVWLSNNVKLIKY